MTRLQKISEMTSLFGEEILQYEQYAVSANYVRYRTKLEFLAFSKHCLRILYSVIHQYLKIKFPALIKTYLYEKTLQVKFYHIMNQYW